MIDMKMDTELKNRISEHLHDAGYTDDQIAEGLNYAEEQGYVSDDDAMSLVMSRILYTDSDLEYGERFAVEPGSW